MALVTELLQRHNVDLANVVELPESYKCARDGTGMGMAGVKAPVNPYIEVIYCREQGALSPCSFHMRVLEIHIW